MKRALFGIFISAVFTLTGVNVSAADKTLKALISWDATGTLYETAENELTFLGNLEGVMYIESSEGLLDEAFVICPISQTFNHKSKKTHAEGKCSVVVSGTDTVYAKISCDGEVGGCKGTFEITSGTGKFKNIKGSSDLIIRSPMKMLIKGLAGHSDITVESGIAFLPKLSYSL